MANQGVTLDPIATSVDLQTPGESAISNNEASSISQNARQPPHLLESYASQRLCAQTLLNHMFHGAQHFIDQSASNPIHLSQPGPTPCSPIEHGYDMIAPDTIIAKNLDRSLQWDPAYRPPTQTRDFLIPPVLKPTIRWVKTTWQDLVQRTPKFILPRHGSPDPPPLHNPAQGDPWEISPASLQASYDVYPPSRNFFDVNSQPQPKDVPSTSTSIAQDSVFFTPPIDNVALQLRAPLEQQNVAQIPPPQKSSRTSYRCIECTFAHTKCVMTPGRPELPCSRCTSLLGKQIPIAYDSTDFISYTIVLDIESSQLLLTNLRYEAEELTGLQPGVSLEDCFDGSICCHMDHSVSQTPSYALSGVPVVIKHLATTRMAKTSSDNLKLELPFPALDANQMDSFIDIGNRMCDLTDLQPIEKNIIVTALRCSDYLGILFNWDRNGICYEVGSRGASLSQAKNLVLETAYAIAYRVQELFMLLSFQVNRSLTEPNNPEHDPGTILCALWIVYSSLNKFREMKGDAKSLKNLAKFLNGLHKRAPRALKALERYRREVAFKQCGQSSQNITAFKKLVDGTKIPKSLTSFRYERLGHMITIPVYSNQQSYTDVLESQEEDLLFLGTYRFPESTPTRNPSSTAYSTITLAEFKECDETLIENHGAHSVRSYGSYEGSVTSVSSTAEDNAPPLTTEMTTIEDMETEVNEEISRLKERLAVLKKMRVGVNGHIPPFPKDKTYDHDGMLAHLAEMKNDAVNQSRKVKISHKRPNLKRRKSKRTCKPVDSRRPSIASSSPEQKRQRKDEASPQPYIQLGDTSWSAAEGDSSAFFWDHEFNFENMRND